MRKFNKTSYFNSFAKLPISTAEKFKGSSVLITGANGLIGGTLLDYFLYLNDVHLADIKISVIVRKSLQKHDFFDYTNVNIILNDIIEYSDVNLNVDFIFHTASNAHPKAYSEEPVETALANILGTKNLIELALKQKAHLVFTSSSEVYGEAFNEKSYRSENEYGYIDILSPRSSYSESKRAAETLIASYVDEYGLKSSIVRPAYIYGARFTESNTRADVSFIKNALANEAIVLHSEGLQKRSYCYVIDCINAMLVVALSGGNGDAFNISSDSGNVMLRDFAKEIAMQANVDLVISPQTTVGGSPIQNSLLSNEKLKSLGWKEIFSLTEGVSDIFKIFE